MTVFAAIRLARVIEGCGSRAAGKTLLNDRYEEKDSGTSDPGHCLLPSNRYHPYGIVREPCGRLAADVHDGVKQLHAANRNPDRCL
jgi:hypothetical protein